LLRVFVSELGGIREGLRKLRESPETATDEPERGVGRDQAHEGVQRRWWQRWFGG
jgi:hypothetical protein